MTSIESLRSRINQVDTAFRRGYLIIALLLTAAIAVAALTIIWQAEISSLWQKIAIWTNGILIAFFCYIAMRRIGDPVLQEFASILTEIEQSHKDAESKGVHPDVNS